MQYTYCTAVNIYNYNKPWFRNGVEYVININRKKSTSSSFLEI